MKRLKVHGVLFALLVLFLYAMGVYDLFMMLGHDAAYYAVHGYGQQVTAYFTDYPFPFLALWVINLACGVLAPLLYLMKRPAAAPAALLSAAADALLLLFTCLLRSRIAVLGSFVFGFDLFILAVTLCFGLHAGRAMQAHRAHE